MNSLPVPGANELAPLDQFKVTIRPTLLLDYLAAHGHNDAVPLWHDPESIEVTHYGFSPLTGYLLVYRKSIDATMPSVRAFLGYLD